MYLISCDSSRSFQSLLYSFMTSIQTNTNLNSLVIERWFCYLGFCPPCCFRQLQFQQNNHFKHNTSDDYSHWGVRVQCALVKTGKTVLVILAMKMEGKPSKYSAVEVFCFVLGNE